MEGVEPPADVGQHAPTNFRVDSSPRLRQPQALPLVRCISAGLVRTFWRERETFQNEARLDVSHKDWANRRAQCNCSSLRGDQEDVGCTGDRQSEDPRALLEEALIISEFEGQRNHSFAEESQNQELQLVGLVYPYMSRCDRIKSCWKYRHSMYGDIGSM